MNSFTSYTTGFNYRNRNDLSYRFFKRLMVLAIFTLVFSTVLYAQTQEQFIEKGDLATTSHDHYAASKFYRQAMDIDSAYLEVAYKYAESLRMYNDYKKAEPCYYYIYKKDRGKKYPLAPFWYATMLKYNGDYSKAKKMFRRSKRFFNRDKKGYHYLKVMQGIKSCQTAIELMKDTLQIHVQNFGTPINTYAGELGGTLLNDSTIIYSSLRDEEMKDDNVVTDTSSYLFRLLQGSKNGEIWNSDSRLEEKINVSNHHIANGYLNVESNTFYYNKCSKDFICDIYAIKYENGVWKTPYEVKNVNIEDYTSSQPYATTINGKEVLFFTSNRPGGKGKKDIWFTRKKSNGEFQEPANAGDNINSIDDEITPFYSIKDTALYFSSNWYVGLGGFDIFKSRYDLSNFSKPENLGYPINSSANDLYYSIYKSTVLLTSNRVGSFTKKGETCCNDIYTYEIPDTIRPLYTSLEELNRYLPVKLYFHNDSPNPRSNDTTTTLNYMETYKSYTRLYNTYKREYSKGLKGDKKEDALIDMEDLFIEHIEKGANDLALFTPLLIKELEKGTSVNITLKGYASPLANKDYNVKLTGRRVASLINYLKAYEKGKILPYINGTAENGAQLGFEKVSYGEYQSDQNISDNINDKKNSIYSRQAALARKIEIIALITNDSNNTAMDGSELEKLPVLTFKDTVITFASGVKEKRLKIINSGDAPLRIFTANFNCEGFRITLPEKDMERYQIEYMTITYDGNGQIPENCYIEFLTNTIPNRIKKQIRFE